MNQSIQDRNDEIAERIDDLPILHCAICGEREGSAYASRCCTEDQMIEA